MSLSFSLLALHFVNLRMQMRMYICITRAEPRASRVRLQRASCIRVEVVYLNALFSYLVESRN